VPARRAFANGVISAAQSAGTVAGPAVGSVAAAIGGLRAPFVLVAATSAIAFVGTLFLRAPVSDARRGDDAGAGEEDPLPVRSLATLLVANIALLASYGAFITTYGPMATTRLGWSIVEVGIAFSFFGGGSILLGPWLAHLADRVGRRPVAVLSPIPLTGFAIGLVIGLPQPAVFAIAFFGGAGLTAFSASWYALLAETAGERRLSRTFGIISAASTIGIVIGALGAAQLWARVDIAAGMLLGAIMPLVACLVMLLYRPRALPLAA
jgi:predicted MFS family arabinose efflux permease